MNQFPKGKEYANCYFLYLICVILVNSNSSQTYPDPLDLLSFPNKTGLNLTRFPGRWHSSDPCHLSVPHRAELIREQLVLGLTIWLFNLILPPAPFFRTEKKKKYIKISSMTLINVEVDIHRHSTLTEQKLHVRKLHLLHSWQERSLLEDMNCYCSPVSEDTHFSFLLSLLWYSSVYFHFFGWRTRLFCLQFLRSSAIKQRDFVFSFLQSTGNKRIVRKWVSRFFFALIQKISGLRFCTFACLNS